MFYFGHVSPKQFINRLSKLLKLKTALPKHRKCFGEDSARLIIPIQGDSRFVIRVAITSINYGGDLLIEMDFRELLRVENSSKIYAKKDAEWFAVIFGPNERKRMRATCQELADTIYYHIDAVEGMQASDFSDLSFVEES